MERRCKQKLKYLFSFIISQNEGEKPDKNSLADILEWYICFLFMLLKPPILIYSKNVFNQDPLPLGTSFHFIVSDFSNTESLPRGRFFLGMILINWSSSWKMLEIQRLGGGEGENSLGNVILIL